MSVQDVRAELTVTADPSIDRLVVQSATLAAAGYADTFVINHTESAIDGESFSCYQTGMIAPTLNGLLDRFAAWIAR